MPAASLLTQVVVDALDPRALARWWAEALGWELSYEDDDESDVTPPAGQPGIELVVVQVNGPKTGPNRIHLDLSSSSAEHQRQQVDRLLGLGARPADVGQGSTPWTVLADPEGNEFCVLDPREIYAGTGAVAAIVVQSLDPDRLLEFWEPASGWSRVPGVGPHALRHNDSGPFLEFVESPAPFVGKNRWHLDLRPTAEGPGRDRALELLVSAGARPADIGQGDGPEITWTVLADPEDNEFCLLRGAV